MSISELTRLVFPPDGPVERGSKDMWNAIASKVGVVLPHEYFEYGVMYGSGAICGGFLTIANWGAPHYYEFVAQEKEVITGAGTSYQNVIRAAGSHGQDVVIVDSELLFPWGRDENGSSLCWKIAEIPDDWSVVVQSVEGRTYEYNMTMTEFLVQVLSNRLSCPVWHEPFLPDDLIFEPVSQ